MIQDVMRGNIGKTFYWNDKLIMIVNCINCYYGDFYVYTISGSEKTYRINIWTEDGEAFTDRIPKETQK